MVSVLNAPVAAAIAIPLLFGAIVAPGLAAAHSAPCPTAVKASVHTVKARPRVKTVKVKSGRTAAPCACAVRTVVKYVTVPERRPPEQVVVYRTAPPVYRDPPRTVVYRAQPRVWYPHARERIVEGPVRVVYADRIREDRVRVVHHYDYDSVPRHHQWQRYPDWIEHQ